MNPKKHILPTIVISQFFCTSLWFAGNGVMNDLTSHFGLGENALGHLTSTVQFGFITGTLIFAILSIADRYPPSKVFFVCALVGAVFNIGIVLKSNTFTSILVFRFLTGFFLAGIYPVGMKIASDYYDKGLGKSLGYLVGALVIGTALPHLLKDIKGELPWEYILYITSTLAVIGGLLMIRLVPDGPYRKSGQKLDLHAIPNVFRDPKFRTAAFGYFGHMWELYAFWAFVPILLQLYIDISPQTTFNIPLLSFIIIGIGGLSCVLGGYISLRMGEKKVAYTTLLLSCICCLIFPIILLYCSPVIYVSFLLFWGMVVIADSPLFSTLVAHSAPPKLKGTALTITNSIGFFLTIVSIQLIDYLRIITDNSASVFMILALGPIIGLIGLIGKKKKSSAFQSSN